jgi:DNA polymerase-3 subunit delta
LDQELAKLASYAGERAIITAEMVEELVGGWRTKTIWNLLDAALDGNSADALLQLDRLIHAGEAPIALMGQLSSTLRRFAVATRIVQEAQRQRQRMGLRDALQQAGMRPFVLAKSETQLRRLGRIRAGKLLDWLLETDLALKGESSRGPRARIALEQLIVRLAAPAASPARGTRKPASAAHP